MSRSCGVVRLFVTLSATLGLALAFSSQATAQSASASASPGASQYDPGVSAANATADIPPAVSDNAGQGTGALNDALTEDSASPAPAVEAATEEAAAEDAATEEAVASPAASPGENITSLPETGGPSLASLLAGTSLLGVALLLLRSSLRKA